MAAGTSASLCWLIFVFASVYADQKTITAEYGQDVTLTCRAPNNNIIAVKWSRDNLGKDYVLYYKDGKPVPDDQHPSFKNRVDLQDRQMKDGDVSLILKNVMINDAGRYECQVAQREPNKRPSLEPINNVTLSVVPPGQPRRSGVDGSFGLKVCLTVFSLLLLVAVGFAV
ncbi:programmed cell death 1 ligand 1 [Oreochromis niloticus]|uniref:programmed cell death 1 ligand 1 n=1 Tax=Oreochromis niloticus TaxID=8128 RepID=UPI000394632E|nr:programmed cell death 1 ligand 1 [Oreochromis niloticus]XP_005464633.1 programmed cell death 1 ligand 1 [Oreochromis niloticus]